MSKVLKVENGNYSVKVEAGQNIILDTARGTTTGSPSKPAGTVIVRGSLEVEGTTTTVESNNTVIADNDVSSHAEINALRSASKELNNFRLNVCIIYVTLEPCHMCAKAIVDARLAELVFAAKEPKTGSICSIDNFLENKALNHLVEFKYGLSEEISANLLKDFFKQKR